jgi:hypothetical protein
MDWRKEMADDIGSTEQTAEVESAGLLTEGATRMTVVVIALVALAGISAGAWLRLRRP